MHLGHNRSVADLVGAAIQEDADGIAISSYQGGHNEYFRYLLAELRAQNAGHIRVVVGGGGTIAPEEIAALRRELRSDFDLIMRFWDCPKPTVAAIHGYCLGGALELILAEVHEVPEGPAPAGHA